VLQYAKLPIVHTENQAFAVLGVKPATQSNVIKIDSINRQTHLCYIVFLSLYVKKVKVPILIYIEHKGPELIPDSRQSACR